MRKLYGFTVLVPFQQGSAPSHSADRADPGNQGHGVSHPSRCFLPSVCYADTAVTYGGNSEDAVAARTQSCWRLAGGVEKPPPPLPGAVSGDSRPPPPPLLGLPCSTSTKSCYRGRRTVPPLQERRLRKKKAGMVHTQGHEVGCGGGLWGAGPCGRAPPAPPGLTATRPAGLPA